MIFASKNLSPQPDVAHILAVLNIGGDYSPRRELAPATAHPHNPILVQFREDAQAASMGEQESDLDDYDWLLGPDWMNFWADSVTFEQVLHARAVLGRLKGKAGQL